MSFICGKDFLLFHPGPLTCDENLFPVIYFSLFKVNISQCPRTSAIQNSSINPSQPGKGWIQGYSHPTQPPQWPSDEIPFPSIPKYCSIQYPKELHFKSAPHLGNTWKTRLLGKAGRLLSFFQEIPGGSSSKGKFLKFEMIK